MSALTGRQPLDKGVFPFAKPRTRIKIADRNSCRQRLNAILDGPGAGRLRQWFQTLRIYGPKKHRRDESREKPCQFGLIECGAMGNR
jgi:hypothetical protein